MLKIKDDVDLKELEKFKKYDFIKQNEFYYGAYYNDDEENYHIEFVKIYIMIDDRTIHFMGSRKWLKNYKPKWIKDLIQAGLVEKVEN